MIYLHLAPDERELSHPQEVRVTYQLHISAEPETAADENRVNIREAVQA